jgi:hypothetical protein
MSRAILVVLGLAASVASGAERVVWQIGKPDRDYRELAIAGNHAAFPKQFAQPVVFEPGKSDPARDWPFIHPGPVDAWAGHRVHPFVVRFALADQPRGLFRLRIELVNTHYGMPPTYAVTVAGRQGRFRLPAGASDEALTNPKAGKPHTIEISLPPTMFAKGQNEVRLECLEGSWVLYDAVTLSNDPDAAMPEPRIQSLSVSGTPFYLRAGGKVRRAVDVAVQANVPVGDMTIRVEAGGETVEVPVKQLPQFGTIVQEVGVPDLDGPIDVKATATIDGRSKTATARVEPQRKWRIFVAPSSHTDIGYTDLQPKCAERHDQNTDLAVELCRKYPGFRWNLEVAWQAENYFQSRKDDRLKPFVEMAKAGRIGVQALYCNILTGLCSHEEACRLMSFAHRLSRRTGIPYESAMISDVPTQEASLPMLLAGSGIRYFSSGINNTRAFTFTRFYSKCPAWWEGPDGSRVLMMWMPGYAHAAAWGLDVSIERARPAVLDAIRQHEARKDYPFDAIFLHGAVGDNCPLNPKLAEVVQAWNDRYEFPKVILCRNAEFFEHIEKHFGDKLPVVRGSGGTYWEDGAGSSARETALCRRAHESVANGEKLLALARRVRPAVEYPRRQIEDAWRHSMLYDEHTWGAHCSISQPESEFTKAQWKIKAQFAVDAQREASQVLGQALEAVARLVRTESRSLVVVNPCSWPRTDLVRITLPLDTSIAEPGVPACELSRTDRARELVVLVRDVPACGYRVLRLGQAGSPAAAQEADGTTLESRCYRVAFDRATGGITSLIDKESGRELVDPKAPYRLNQYLYVSGGKDTKIVEHGPEAKLSVSSPEKAVLRKMKLGELGEMMVVATSAAMTPRIQSAVFVWNDVKRVDAIHGLTKTQTYDKEAVYFAFPFAAEKPTFRYEIPAGVVNANTEMLPGACLDWFTVQHFVEVADKTGAVAWATPDAPLVCFQDINRGKWQTSLAMTNGHLYAYVMNNYWFTNYLAGQGGDFEFRFSITSRPKADTVASARFGWAVSNPLSAVAAGPNPDGPLAASSASLVSIDEPNVLLIGAKQADEGDALILRLWEAAGQATTAHVRLGNAPAKKSPHINHV